MYKSEIMKSKVYLALSYIYFLQGDDKTSNEYFDLHESMEHKTTLEIITRGGSGRALMMKKPIKFWTEKGLK